MNHRWPRTVFASVVFLLAVFFTAGCGGKDSGEKAAEKMAEKILERSSGEKADVDYDRGKLTVKTKDYETESVETAEWPNDLPGVPRFAYGKVERVSRSENKADGARSYSVWLHDVDSDAAAKYEADLEKAGWETMLVEMGDQGAMVSGQREGLLVHFMHSKEEKSGNLTVTAE
ncbi:MAG: hypothetical protein FJY73_14160 [Candidatus Eisenbacteria bacterium]|nr:hypothetical protein [Candidatus Eisenbacteria bacterium]